MKLSKLNSYDFNLMISEMHKSELIELLNHPNFKDRKELIENQLNK